MKIKKIISEKRENTHRVTQGYEEFNRTLGRGTQDTPKNRTDNSVDVIRNTRKQIFLDDSISEKTLRERIRTIVDEYITEDTVNYILSLRQLLTEPSNSKFKRELDKNIPAEKCLLNVCNELDKIFFSGNNNASRTDIRNGTTEIGNGTFVNTIPNMNDINNLDNNENVTQNLLQIFANQSYDEALKYYNDINKKTNESFENDDINLLLEDDEETSDDKKIDDNVDKTESNKSLLLAKCAIIGYKGSWGHIKRWSKDGCPFEDRKYPELWEELNNENNLLRWLSESSWKELNSTFMLPVEGKDDKHKISTGKKIAKHIVNILTEYLFKCKIPASMKNLIKTINDSFAYKIFPWQYKEYKFGGKKLSFMINDVKSDYLETVNNGEHMSLNIKIMKMLKPIDADYFWKNVKVYLCRTEKAFDIINSAVKKSLDSRNGVWDMNFKQIMTGLKTQTYLYRIEYKDSSKMRKDNEENIDKIICKACGLRTLDDNNEKDTYVKRFINNFKSDDKKRDERVLPGLKLKAGVMAKYDKGVLNEAPKFYYIIVTEGLIKQGKFLKNLANSTMNKLNNSNDKMHNAIMGKM